jgi:hypothetical protein
MMADVYRNGWNCRVDDLPPGTLIKECVSIADMTKVDTIAKRLMSNHGKITSSAQLSTVIFKDKATAPFGTRFFSLFPGLGYAAVYKVRWMALIARG